MQDFILRDQLDTVHKRLDNWNRRRKLDRDEVRELRERLDVVMTFLDGAYNGNRQFHKVGLKPQEAEEDA